MRILRTPLFLLLCLVGLSTSASAQMGLELGLKAGGSLYSGDLSSAEKAVDFEDVNFAGGLYLRYRPTDRFGIRVNGNFGRLSAERETVVATENGSRLPVSRNFRSSLTEFNVVAEFDLFYLGDVENNFVAPYVYGGIGVLSFNPEGELDGVYYDLQPLRTEGQGTINGVDPNITYPATPYELTRAVGIAGGGVRARFGGRFVVGLEAGVRFTGTDYIDDVSNQRVNYLDVLNGPDGALAARFSNPTVQDPTEASSFNYTRGGEFNDYYFVGGLTFGMTIGGGGNNKTGCYTF